MSEQFWQRLNNIFGFLTIGIVFGLTAFMASLEVKDLDLWLHLKMGQYISEHKVVPTHDILSDTIAGKPWVNHEWLFQIVVYQIWHVGGFDALINMQIWVVFLTFLILLFLGYSKERQFLTASFLLLVLFVYQTRFTIRPDIFSLLFFVCFVWILAWFLERRWSLWALVIIQVLWSNTHGFFFFGPLLVIIAIISEFLKRRMPLPWEWNQIGRLSDEEYLRLKKILLWLIVACCLNPLALKGAWYPIGVLLGLGQSGSKVFFTHITELQQPITAATIWTKQNGPYKILIILSALGLFLNRRKIDISTLFIWLIFLVFSLVAIRNMVFFAIASYLVFMANMTTLRWQDVLPFRFSQDKFKYITGIAFKLALAFWMIDCGTKIAVNGYFDYDTYERKSEFGGVSQKSFPYHGVDFLVKNQVKGNFFNDFNSGAYLIGRCYPNIKVYIDGRTEEYGGEFFEHYQKIWRDGDQKMFLADAAKYNITGAFLNNNNQWIPSKVLKMFYQMPDWKIVYFDYDAVIFLKNVPANKVWIDRFSIDLKKWQPKSIDLERLGTKRIDPMPFTNRAYLYKALGMYDAVFKETRQALKIAPDDFDSFKFLGAAYESKGDYRRAFECFRIATVLRPYEVDVRLNLASTYEHLKNFRGAVEQYQRVTEVDPKNFRAYLGLARSFAITGQDKKALDFLSRIPPTTSEDKLEVKKIRDSIEKIKQPKAIEPSKKNS